MKRILLVAAALVALGACATRTQMGRKFTTEDVMKIQICHTTRADLISMFGEPIREGAQSGLLTLTWQYADVTYDPWHPGDYVRNVQKGTGTLIAFLNQQGTVVDYAYNPAGQVEAEDRCQ